MEKFIPMRSFQEGKRSRDLSCRNTWGEIEPRYLKT